MDGWSWSVSNCPFFVLLWRCAFLLLWRQEKETFPWWKLFNCLHIHQKDLRWDFLLYARRTKKPKPITPIQIYNNGFLSSAISLWGFLRFPISTSEPLLNVRLQYDPMYERGMLKSFYERVGMTKIYVMDKTKYILPKGMNNAKASGEQCELTRLTMYLNTKRGREKKSEWFTMNYNTSNILYYRTDIWAVNPWDPHDLIRGCTVSAERYLWIN